MKNIILVRHGKDEKNSLTQLGRNQIQQMAIYLKTDLKLSGKIHLICSPLKRAMQSAEIIANSLGLKMYPDELFDDNLEYSSDLQKAVADILEIGSDFDHVIVVTHQPATMGLPIYLLKTCFPDNPENPYVPPTINGKANIFDCETGEIHFNLP
ncbi:histidine phosphatase family protein [Patescibacteria group bacterium]